MEFPRLFRREIPLRAPLVTVDAQQHGKPFPRRLFEFPEKAQLRFPVLLEGRFQRHAESARKRRGSAERKRVGLREISPQRKPAR